MRQGDRLDSRFVLRTKLERTTWLAYDGRLGRDVVLKQVAPGEPRAMARLNHPHVITVYEHAGDWAVLEYAPGSSLAGRELTPVDAARIGAQIADALVYMHAKGLVHCDVKPDNIVLAEDGTAKLTDFGSAYRVDPEQTITPVSRLSYTPAYAAPELVHGAARSRPPTCTRWPRPYVRWSPRTCPRWRGCWTPTRTSVRTPPRPGAASRRWPTVWTKRPARHPHNCRPMSTVSPGGPPSWAGSTGGSPARPASSQPP